MDMESLGKQEEVWEAGTLHSEHKDYQVGEAVYDGRKPEKYGKIIGLRVEKKQWYDGEEYDYVFVTWRRPYRDGFKDEEVPAHHLSRFDAFLSSQQTLLEKWKWLKSKADEIDGR